MITDQVIINAYLCALDTNGKPGAHRQLRAIFDKDFAEIRKVKEAFDALWKREELVYGPKETYYLFRKRKLNEWGARCQWQPETRHLYASLLSVLTNWGRQQWQLSAKDRQRIERMRPGAMPILWQTIPNQVRTLF